MCAGQALLKRFVWTEYHGKGSLQISFKPLTCKWSSYFVKMDFYMIGQAKRVRDVNKASCRSFCQCLAKACPNIDAITFGASSTLTHTIYTQSSLTGEFQAALLCRHSLPCSSCCSMASRMRPSTASCI